MRARLAAAREGDKPAETDHGATIDRIGELTRTARTSCFGLLSYMAFVGVTLMEVKDEDVFLVEKQTELPLIGVSIPTFLFFAFAPTLGTALFAYLHLHLMKLWEALADAPAAWRGAPLSDHVAPWVVTDFALARKPGALRPRPMRWLVRLVGFALVHLGAPFVLCFFWWRSMPAHEPWLTVLGCGGSLILSLYIALVSWRQLIRLVGARPGWRNGWRWAVGGTAIFVAVAIVAVGWFRSGEPAGTYLDPVALAYLERRDAAELEEADENRKADILDTHKQTVDALFWNKTPFSMASADLRKVNFAYLPEGWKPHDKARKLSRIILRQARDSRTGLRFLRSGGTARPRCRDPDAQGLLRGALRRGSR